MARRGIANFDPRGSEHTDTVWWREVLHCTRDGIPDASTMLDARRGRSNYLGLQTTASEALRQPWERARPGDRHSRSWHPARVLSEGLGEHGRAGKSSWHHNTHKPATCRVGHLQTSSAAFSSEHPPHITATMTPRRQQPLGRTGFAENTSPRPMPEAAPYHTLPAMGFRSHYHPKLI
mmetsp:Transcript_80436/g.260634  ORF Transcript_80436/g.260634 Transcript_80436/m.260634 type:complete len:178 (+) Transcript_80436:49-582(+)